MTWLGTIGGMGQGVRTHRWRSHRYSIRIGVGSRGDTLESERLANLFLGEHSDEDLAPADGNIVRDLGASLRLQTHITFASVDALQKKDG